MRVRVTLTWEGDIRDIPQSNRVAILALERILMQADSHQMKLGGGQTMLIEKISDEGESK